MGVLKSNDDDDDVSTRNEYTRMIVNLGEKQVCIEINRSYLFSKRLFPKIPVKNVFFNVDCLTMSDNNFDIVRTTTDYTYQFNKVISKFVDTIVDEHGKILIPQMLGYSDGHSFVGEAFVNFVTAIAVYEMFPNETSSELTTYANLFRNNNYIADMYSNTKFAKYLTKTKKDQNIGPKKTAKQLAGSFKGLIGMLYKENGIGKMIDIMKYVNEELIPNNIVDFTGKENSNTLINSFLITISTLVGWLSCYITMTIYHASVVPASPTMKCPELF